MSKNDIKQIEEKLRKKVPMVALVAPSFLTDFEYPAIIYQLKKLGFDKVVELTFGAKMVNGEYHKLLKKSKKLVIASPCPGVVSTLQNNFPKLKNQIALVDSPLVAMAKICKKHFPKHQVIFLSPCDFKKIESEQTKYVDGVIDYWQLKELFTKYKIKKPFLRGKHQFDKFYNDYTKVYPLSGGLSETAHLKDVLKKDEVKIIDGIADIMKFLKKPDPKIKFLDCLFCVGGCIGGPHTNKEISLENKHDLVIKYLEKSKRENIPEDRKGLIKKASGLKFSS